MLGNFPDPYPDELLYSACARYSDRVQIPDHRNLMKRLFDDPGFMPTVDLQNNLDALIAALPPGHQYSADILIDYHTLFPFYAPFLREPNYARIRQNMRGSDCRTTQLQAGIITGGVSAPDRMRTCPACDQEDHRNYGETYWHRLHQLAGVEVCPIHEVFLEPTSQLRRQPLQRHRLVSAESVERCRRAKPIRKSDHQHCALLQIAHSTRSLLDQHDLRPDPGFIRHRYLQLLIEKGYAPASGFVYSEKLRADFISFYSARLLELLQSHVPTNGDPKWLARIVRKPRGIQSPLRHLLLMNFLQVLPDKFFHHPVSKSRIAPGVRCCLNAVCPSYNRPVSKPIRGESDSTSKQSETFACETCGYEYKLTVGPPPTPHSVVQYGPLWDSQLRRLWVDRAVSLRHLSKLLRVDPLTAKRQAVRLQLPFPRIAIGRLTRLPHAPRAIRTVRFEDRRETKRQHFISIQSENPNSTRVQLQEKCGRLYTWLYRNDRDWFIQRLPLRRRCGKPARRIDWELRDYEIAAKVLQVAIERKRHPESLKRITTSLLGRLTGQTVNITKHIDRLPLTAVAIKGLVESTENFAIRRVNTVRDQYLAARRIPTRSDFMYKAGLGTKIKQHPNVQLAIENALRVMKDTIPVAPPPQPARLLAECTVSEQC